MTDQPESKEERARRKARERQARKRLKDAAAAARAQAREVKFDAYKSTQESLELICQLGGFEEEAEALTLIIHNVAELAKRDRHAFDLLTRIPSRSSAPDA